LGTLIANTVLSVHSLTILAAAFGLIDHFIATFGPIEPFV